MIISTGRSRRDKHWRQETITWEELNARLGSFHRTAETEREYHAMSKDDRSERKDIGGFVGGRLSGARRCKSGVIDRCLVTLDADYAVPGLPEDVDALWEMTMAVYSTHSSTRDAPRYRFIIPLDRAVSPEEYTPIARKLAERIGLDYMDPSTYAPERLMYWPSCPVDSSPEYYSFKGNIVCADSVLAEYGGGDNWRDSRLWPIAKGEQEIVRRESDRQGDPTVKPGIVGLFCRTYDIHAAIETFLPGVYESAGDSRYTYTAGSTAAGAVVYQDGAFLYSNHGTDPVSGLLVNAFDLVRIHLYGSRDLDYRGKDITKAPSYLAMSRLASEDGAVRATMAAERMADCQAMFGDLAGADVSPEDVTADDESGASADGSGAPAAEEDDGWRGQLTVNRKTGECEPTINNAHLILSHDPLLRDAFALNDLRGRPVIRRSVPWHRVIRDPRNGDNWEDADNAELRLYMETGWQYTAKDRLQDAFDSVCRRHRFHPVREYLSALEWDGTERLDTLLIRYFNAEDNDYVRVVTRKWLTAAVKRIYEPGCKFDSVLVLVGQQGAGKSRFFGTLAQGWFNDSLGRMDASKGAFESVMGSWIVEIAELAAAKRAEVEDIKNFITKQSDTFRRAYQREVGEYPRQCVFAATTNSPEVLRDRSGGRRFWLVDVDRLDNGRLDGLANEVDQIWAEAVTRYRAGEVLWLDDDRVRAQAEAQQLYHAVQDDDEGLIIDYINMPVPPDWDDMSLPDRRDWTLGYSPRRKAEEDSGECKPRDQVCLWDIRADLYGVSFGQAARDAGASLRLADIMGHLPGWHKGRRKQRVKPFGIQWVYVRDGSGRAEFVDC